MLYRRDCQGVMGLGRTEWGSRHAWTAAPEFCTHSAMFFRLIATAFEPNALSTSNSFRETPAPNALQAATKPHMHDLAPAYMLVLHTICSLYTMISQQSAATAGHTSCRRAAERPGTADVWQLRQQSDTLHRRRTQ